MSVQRTAALLPERSNNFAAMLSQHLHGVAVDVAENQILGAADQHGDPVTLLTAGRCDRSDELSGEAGLDRGGHGLEFLQALGEELKNPALPEQRLEAEFLVKPEKASEQAQARQVHEQPVDGEV